MSLREEQCKKVCRILDDVLANRPTERDSLIVAVRKAFDAMQTAEPHEIGYDDCANALLKMWMDNVLTDGDYYRITDKLNKKWGKTELPEPYTEPYKGVME